LKRGTPERAGVKPKSGAAIHGFAKDAEYAARAVEMGFYLSIGRRAVQERNESLLEAVRQIALDWILTRPTPMTPLVSWGWRRR